MFKDKDKQTEEHTYNVTHFPEPPKDKGEELRLFWHIDRFLLDKPKNRATECLTIFTVCLLHFTVLTIFGISFTKNT